MPVGIDSSNFIFKTNCAYQLSDSGVDAFYFFTLPITVANEEITILYASEGQIQDIIPVLTWNNTATIVHNKPNLTIFTELRNDKLLVLFKITTAIPHILTPIPEDAPEYSTYPTPFLPNVLNYFSQYTNVINLQPVILNMNNNWILPTAQYPIPLKIGSNGYIKFRILKDPDIYGEPYYSGYFILTMQSNKNIKFALASVDTYATQYSVFDFSNSGTGNIQQWPFYIYNHSGLYYYEILVKTFDAEPGDTVTISCELDPNYPAPPPPAPPPPPPPPPGWYGAGGGPYNDLQSCTTAAVEAFRAEYPDANNIRQNSYDTEVWDGVSNSWTTVIEGRLFGSLDWTLRQSYTFNRQ